MVSTEGSVVSVRVVVSVPVVAVVLLLPSLVASLPWIVSHPWWLHSVLVQTLLWHASDRHRIWRLRWGTWL